MKGLAIATFLGASIASTGCSRADRSAPPATGEVVDDALLAYLSAARALHHEADMAEEANNPKASIVALSRILQSPIPKPAPEIDEVLADTRARLADLRSRPAAGGEFDAALRDIDEGLKLVPRTSYLRGHLFEIRGVVLERRIQSIASVGDSAATTRMKEDAMKAYEEAIAIQHEVIRAAATARALDGGKR